MAITENYFNGNGSNLGPFTFDFSWLDPSDIYVSVDGIIKAAGTHYNLQALNYATRSGGEVLFTAGNEPPSGINNIRIFRETDDDNILSTFVSGSAIRAQDLNENFMQALYVTQEVRDIAVSASTANIANNSITTVKLANDAVTTTKIANSAVTGPKIASGAITETKLGTASVTTSKIGINAVTTSRAVIATQAEAEAGTSSAAFMTPERTKQAIAFQKGAEYQEFTSSGTWTKPDSINYVMVEVWGAGGGGASGDRSTGTIGGSGGGGGAYIYKIFRASDLGATETVTIGAGGTGGTALTANGYGNSGTVGGNTTFGTKLTGYGGIGGQKSAGGTNSGGGGGGTTSYGTASIRSLGGNPRNSIEIAPNQEPLAQIYGGGSGGYPISNFSNSYPAGNSVYGGGGGGSGFNLAQLSGAGSVYGGPGGGAGSGNSNLAGPGGNQTLNQGGGGAAGTVSSVDGSAGTGFQGGGGGYLGTAANAGAGGNGGVASGGGGGGYSTSLYISGAGGNGGSGLCRVYTW